MLIARCAARARGSPRSRRRSCASCSGTVRREPTAKASSPATPLLAQQRERGVDVAVDAQLDDLAAEGWRAARRRVERDDLARVHDRDAVAEPLRLVEVVRRQQDRQSPRGRAGRRSRRAARRGCADRARRSARRGTARAGARRARGRSRAAGARRRCRSRPARSTSSGRPSAAASSSIRAASPACSTPQSRAWSSRFRRPVSERSTTGSWKTTLLSAPRGERLGARRRSPRAGRCRASARSSSSASRPSSTCPRRSGRAGRRPRPARRRSRSPSPPRRRRGRSCSRPSLRWRIHAAPFARSHRRRSFVRGMTDPNERM